MTSSPSPAMWRALFALELRMQWREPLTTLYVLVFLLLSFGYTASGAVELVGVRDGVSKDAPWALALAFGGLTAFGQVITTMVSATALLRDAALRTLPLVASTHASPRTWFTARLSAALAVLLCVCAAMPIGAFAGARVAALNGIPAVSGPLTYLATFLIISVPTSIVVVALLGAVAARTGRIMPVLAAALALVGLWQLALGLEAHEATRTIGALLDPFGNAPVLALTRGWTLAERGVRALPVAGLLLWNRVLWLGISIGVVTATARMVRWPAIADRATVRRPAAAHASGVDRRAGQTAPFATLVRFTATWMLRDGGWRIVMALAVVNASLNAWTRAPAQPTLGELCALVAEHARLFLILLATVYAGEVLWREREVRIDAMFDAAPVSTRLLAAGRLTGLFVAQVPVVALLGVAALCIALLRLAGGTLHATDQVAAASSFAAWLVFTLWLPFAQLTALSVAVHVVVRHKVLAHLLLITGWVVAVTLDRHGASSWWYRFAEAAPLAADSSVDWAATLLRATWWTLVSVALLVLAVQRWPRGVAATSPTR